MATKHTRMGWAICNICKRTYCRRILRFLLFFLLQPITFNSQQSRADVRGNTDENHTDMGHIVHYGRSAFSQSNHSWLSATQMLTIQIQPHSPQNTHTHIYQKIRLFCPKSQSISSAPIRWQVQPSGESTRIQRNNFPLIFFFWGGGGGGLILCVTLYTTKQCVFFTTKTSVFERELFHNRYKQ